MLPYILQAEKLSVSQAHNLKKNNGDYVTLLLLFLCCALCWGVERLKELRPEKK